MLSKSGGSKAGWISEGAISWGEENSWVPAAGCIREMMRVKREDVKL
jgi:hypothetical protein